MCTSRMEDLLDAGGTCWSEATCGAGVGLVAGGVGLLLRLALVACMYWHGKKSSSTLR